MYDQDIHIQEELSDDELRIMNTCKSVVGREIEKELSEKPVLTDLPHLINKSILKYNNSTSIRLQKVRHLYILKNSDKICTTVTEEPLSNEVEEENDKSDDEVSNEQNCSYSSSQPKKRSLVILTSNDIELLNRLPKKSKFHVPKKTGKDEDVISNGSMANAEEEVKVDDDDSYHFSDNSQSDSESDNDEPESTNTTVRVKRTAGKIPRRSVVSDAAKNRGTFEKKDEAATV